MKRELIGFLFLGCIAGFWLGLAVTYINLY